MGKQQSLRSKAVHFVSDITTVLLNPISDKPSARTSAQPQPQPQPQPHSPEDGSDLQDDSELGSASEQGSEFSVDGPDTSSFTAFLYSLLSSSESSNSNKRSDNQAEAGNQPMNNAAKEPVVKKSLYSRGKQSLGRAMHHAARITGYRNQERKSDIDMKVNDVKVSGIEMMEKSNVKEVASSVDIPDVSEPSLLLSEKTRSVLYASLPALVQGRKWILLYSTWRHGISLSTLYRRSFLWPGLSLLVVGDCKGAVFGSLVEAPLRPSSKRKYQGTNNTFVFTNIPGHPVIYRPTGENHYFTLCSPDFLAIGGGSHFALYLDNDLLNGSSSISETYGNPCLANTEEFEVKEVELWGFVYTSKYEEMLALSRTEAPGICRW